MRHAILLIFSSLAFAFPSGEGRLRNRAQNLCLDVAGWNAQGDGNVLVWECNGDPDQRWSFSPDGELLNRATNACLDVAGYDAARGANVGVYRCESLDDQRWRMVPRADGSFELHSRKRELCLDVKGRAGARGDNVLVWDCDGGADQSWTWEPVGAPKRELVYEQPVPRPTAMQGGAFRALVAAVNHEGFSANKLQVIEQAAAANRFLVSQLKELLDTLSFSADKLRAVEMVAPVLVDAENGFLLDGSFPFSEDKARLGRILQRVAKRSPPPPHDPPPPNPPPRGDLRACSSAADCVIFCPRVDGCCGWSCGCANAVRRDQQAAFQAEYARTCRRPPDCPAMACQYRDAAGADCVAGRCVALTR